MQNAKDRKGKSVGNVYKSHEKRWNSRLEKTGSVIYENWAIEKH